MSKFFPSGLCVPPLEAMLELPGKENVRAWIEAASEPAFGELILNLLGKKFEQRSICLGIGALIHVSPNGLLIIVDGAFDAVQTAIRSFRRWTRSLALSEGENLRINQIRTFGNEPDTLLGIEWVKNQAEAAFVSRGLADTAEMGVRHALQKQNDNLRMELLRLQSRQLQRGVRQENIHHMREGSLEVGPIGA